MKVVVEFFVWVGLAFVVVLVVWALQLRWPTPAETDESLRTLSDIAAADVAENQSARFWAAEHRKWGRGVAEKAYSDHFSRPCLFASAETVSGDAGHLTSRYWGFVSFALQQSAAPEFSGRVIVSKIGADALGFEEIYVEAFSEVDFRQVMRRRGLSYFSGMDPAGECPPPVLMPGSG